jgi:hypothetical protein
LIAAARRVLMLRICYHVGGFISYFYFLVKLAIIVLAIRIINIAHEYVAKSIVNEKPVKFKSEMRLREKEKKI